MAIVIQNKHLFLIAAMVVFAIGVGFVISNPVDTNLPWHPADQVDVGNDKSLADLITNGKIDCSEIGGGSDSDFCTDDVGSGGGGIVCTKIFDSNDLSGSPQYNNYYFTKVNIPSQCYNGGMCRYKSKIWANGILRNSGSDMTKWFMTFPDGSWSFEGTDQLTYQNGDSIQTQFVDISDGNIISVWDDYSNSFANYDEKNLNQITVVFINPSGGIWRGELWACY